MDTLLTLLSLVAIASAHIPKGYILDVKAVCTTGSRDAKVRVTSDLNVKAVMICSGMSQTLEIDETKTFVEFPIHYADKKDKKCFFKTHKGRRTNTFQTTLELYWGEPESAGSNEHLHANKEVYKIICTTGRYKIVQSAVQSVGKRPFAPERKGQNKGRITPTRMILTLHDILGKSLTSGKVPIGKKVYLQGRSFSRINGLTPVDCKAISNTKKTYDLLRAGCGDGIVFKPTIGFTTSARITKSPIFTFFNFPGATSIKFSCTFIECSRWCNLKNTCIARKRRSLEEDDQGHVVNPLSVSPKEIPFLKPRSTDEATFPGTVLLVHSSVPATRPVPLLLQEPQGDPRAEPQREKYTMIMVTILSCFTAVSLIVSLYVCTKGRTRSAILDVKS